MVSIRNILIILTLVTLSRISTARVVIFVLVPKNSVVLTKPKLQIGGLFKSAGGLTGAVVGKVSSDVIAKVGEVAQNAAGCDGNGNEQLCDNIQKATLAGQIVSKVVGNKIESEAEVVGNCIDGDPNCVNNVVDQLQEGLDEVKGAVDLAQSGR